MAMVPAGQSPRPGPSLIVRLLRALFAQRAVLHDSVKWDTYGRCQKAECAVCGQLKGVSKKGRMVRHGPVDQEGCLGTGGGTTYPVLTTENAKAARAAADRVLARHPQTPRGKR